ncbi:hypothetical protein D3C76_1750420 [compost metagenome]
MPALPVDSRVKINEVHGVRIACDRTDDGKPGIREAYTDRFYVAYQDDLTTTWAAITIRTLP